MAARWLIVKVVEYVHRCWPREAEGSVTFTRDVRVLPRLDAVLQHPSKCETVEAVVVFRLETFRVCTHETACRKEILRWWSEGRKVVGGKWWWRWRW